MSKIPQFAFGALVSAIFAAGGPCLFAASKSSLKSVEGKNNADTIISADEISGTEGKQRLRGNVEITVGDLNITGEEMIYDSELRIASSPAPVAVNLKNLRLIMNSAEFAGAERKFSAKDVRGGMAPLFFSGTTVAGTDSRVEITSGAIYFAEPHWSSISFDGDLLAYDAEKDRFTLEGAAIYVAGVPVLPLPSFDAIRISRPPLRVWANTGNGSASGIFLRTMTHLTVWEEFEPGVLLDGYERSGVLAGPALAYNTRGDNGNLLQMTGDLKTAYINDTATRANDIYGNEIGGKRGFIEWTHKQKIDRLELSASIHRWSDSEVMRNFRPEIYNQNQNPDSYVELVYPDSRFYVSALTRLHLNDFQNTQQRLPEIRFDLQPTEIKNSGVFAHFNGSFAHLREKRSDGFALWQTNDGDALESTRADFYWGLSVPVKFGDIATLTPVAGLRTTYYDKTVPANADPYWRTLGQIGFDFQLLATGTSDYRNATWEIDGLRHVLRPILQYRYVPGVASQSTRIPRIDRATYQSAPQIIDLGENRAVDEIFDEHVFRVGIENLFQTRNQEYGSRDLVEFNIYQDLRKTYRRGDRSTLSDNFAELKIQPAQWISIDLNTRFDVENFSTKAFFIGTTFRDADIFSAYFGFNYLDNPDLAAYNIDPILRQFSFGAEYRINSYFSVFCDLYYDARRNLFTDQRYGLTQRLGNAWEITYSMRYRQNSRDDDNFSLNVALNFVSF